MFKWLRGGDKMKEAGPQICMPLMKSTDGVTAPRITAAWKSLFPQLPPLTEDKDGTATGKTGEVMMLSSGGATAMIALMPVPIPSNEVQEARRTSWMWKKEHDAALAAYGAHAIVATTGKDQSAVEDAVFISRLAACVLKAAGDGAVGVYWGNGGVVHFPAIFTDMVVNMMSDGDPVPPLWINVIASAAGPNGPYSLSTIGMNHMGHDEFEIVDAATDKPGELRMRLYDIAGYVLASGPVLKDGHTFGVSEEERIKVRVGKSKLGKPGRVIRLEF